MKYSDGIKTLLMIVGDEQEGEVCEEKGEKKRKSRIWGGSRV